MLEITISSSYKNNNCLKLLVTILNDCLYSDIIYQFNCYQDSYFTDSFINTVFHIIIYTVDFIVFSILPLPFYVLLIFIINETI